MPTIEVGILGATGMVGQQFIALLANHPWFKVTWLGASERSAGKAYRDAAAWRLPAPLPDDVARSRWTPRSPDGAPKLVFSGLDSSVAGEIEGAFAQAGHVIVSNSRNYRMEADVPLLIPEVNADHLALLDAQGAARGWKGRIVTNPNCVVVVLRDGAGAAAAVRPEDVDHHDAAGDLRRRLSGRAVVGHSRQRHSVHRRRRGREDRDRDEEDPRRAAAAAPSTNHPRDSQRGGRRACRCRTATPHRFRSRSSSSPSPTRSSRRGTGSAASRRSSACRRRRRSRSSTSPEANRPQPALDANRDGGMTVTVGRLRRCPGARLQVRRARPQHDPRRRRRRDPERGADAREGLSMRSRRAQVSAQCSVLGAQVGWVQCARA